MQTAALPARVWSQKVFFKILGGKITLFLGGTAALRNVELCFIFIRDGSITTLESCFSPPFILSVSFRWKQPRQIILKLEKDKGKMAFRAGSGILEYFGFWSTKVVFVQFYIAQRGSETQKMLRGNPHGYGQISSSRTGLPIKQSYNH